MVDLLDEDVPELYVFSTESIPIEQFIFNYNNLIEIR